MNGSHATESLTPLESALIAEIRTGAKAQAAATQRLADSVDRLAERTPSARLVHAAAGSVVLGLILLLAFAIGGLMLARGLDPERAATAARDVTSALGATP